MKKWTLGAKTRKEEDRGEEKEGKPARREEKDELYMLIEEVQGLELVIPSVSPYTVARLVSSAQ